ncbi:hypothetical protein K437DRAFT_268933 [Tilletiaria anomala UBC 951]|uniref:BTB domain-containing protein n=1 Tax=Tilletiaria anomala (strain ATCC 24038 / CBS 436.72 / UBC 951) TaxID=1037660 RepID=A0A066VYQ0_TILAU|nr:uncharacterized protein K437DRAFT_268933 [Tilletiaria anomala UBC 951]KDN43934.1 hypothetical protein K437DRAFT_268933 [Tilletiaria anomala UBC 951]
MKQIAATDYATACLFHNCDVLVLHNDAAHRVTFPFNRFRADLAMNAYGPHRPQQERAKPIITKITSSGTTFVATSDMGDLFTFSIDQPSDSVRDVTIASDGSAILCTELGHVFVRAKRSEGGGGAQTSKYTPNIGGKGVRKGGFKFYQIPHLQRVVKVAMNASGGFCAIRSDAIGKEIKARGGSLEEALQSQLPHLRTYSLQDSDQGISISVGIMNVMTPVPEVEEQSDTDDGEDERASSLRYVRIAQLIGESVRRRVPVLAKALETPGTKGILPPGVGGKQAAPGIVTLTLPSCSFHTTLFLLHYLYADDLPPVWTASIGMQVERSYSALRIDRETVRNQRQTLAALLQLSALAPSLESPVPRPPTLTLRRDMESAFEKYVSSPDAGADIYDVELRFKRSDRTSSLGDPASVPFVHLGAEPPPFSSGRWKGGLLEIDMTNMQWTIMQVVLRYLYANSGVAVFKGCNQGVAQEDFIDDIVEVLAAVDHLLLEKLSL